MILNQNNVLPYVKMEKFTMNKLHLVNQQEIVKMDKFGMKNQNNAKPMLQKIIIKKEVTMIIKVKTKEEIKMIHMILVMVMIMEVIVLKMIKNMKENVKEVRKFLENVNVLKIKN